MAQNEQTPMWILHTGLNQSNDMIAAQLVLLGTIEEQSISLVLREWPGYHPEQGKNQFFRQLDIKVRDD